MHIELEPDAVQLLRDVDAGRVSRHTTTRGNSPKYGVDLQEHRKDPPFRKATARIKQLAKKGLVELPEGDPAAVTWPWKATTLGATVIEMLDRDTEDGPLDLPSSAERSQLNALAEARQIAQRWRDDTVVPRPPAAAVLDQIATLLLGSRPGGEGSAGMEQY